jgi:hypothetical protein
MSTGRADRACLLNSALLETGVWRKSTAFRHFRACSSKKSRRPYTPHRTRSVPGSGALPDARTISFPVAQSTQHAWLSRGRPSERSRSGTPISACKH